MDSQIPAVCYDLVRVVVRSFYQPVHSVVMELVMRRGCLRSEELQSLLRMGRDGMTYVQILQLHGLLTREVIDEGKEEEQVQTYRGGRKKGGDRKIQYYYVDFKKFIEAVTYRHNMIIKKLEKQDKAESGVQEYICPKCNNQYLDLDVTRLIDMDTGDLVCHVCKTTLEEKVTEKKANRMQEYNMQMKPITDLLKQIEQETKENPLPEKYFWPKQQETATQDQGTQRGSLTGGGGMGGNMGGALSARRPSQYNRPMGGMEATLDVKIVSDRHTKHWEPEDIHDTYLQNLVEKINRKRKREEEGDGGDGNSLARRRSSGLLPPAMDGVAGGEDLATMAGDVLVQVCGMWKPITAVTEEDEQLMTEAEYDAYFKQANRLESMLLC